MCKGVTLASQALDPPPAPGQRCEIGAALHAVVAAVGEPQTGFESPHGLASRYAVSKFSCDCRHRRHTACYCMQCCQQHVVDGSPF